MEATETAKFVSGIRARIMDGTLPSGARLDSERELAQRLGVSRTTIRAGLQALEAAGLIERKVGRGGGSFVTVPDEDSVASSLHLVLGTKGIAELDLMEARLAIEPMCASLAATRMSEGELDALSATQSEMSTAMRAIGNPLDREAFLRANARFHLQIAQGSRNAVLAAMLRGLMGPIEKLTDDPGTLGTAQLRELLRAHEAIFSALRLRRPERAGELMRRHLEAHVRLSLAEPPETRR